MLRSDVCDYNDANIVVKETITLEGTNANNRTDKKLSFKNNPPFRSCISKINDTLIDNAEDLDFVMLMYNQLEYSDNFSKTSESLQNHYRYEVNAHENNADSYRINNTTRTSKSFEYKTKLIGSTPVDNNTLDPEVIVPLKYLSNFQRSLDLSLINCKLELDLSFSIKSIISKINRIPTVPADIDGNPPNEHNPPTLTSDATIQINIATLMSLQSLCL